MPSTWSSLDPVRSYLMRRVGPCVKIDPYTSQASTAVLDRSSKVRVDPTIGVRTARKGGRTIVRARPGLVG